MASHAEVINDLRARAKPLLVSHAGNQLLARSMLRGADHMAQMMGIAALCRPLVNAIIEDVHELAECVALFRPDGRWDIDNVEIDGRLLQRALLLIGAIVVYGDEIELTPLVADVVARVRWEHNLT